MDFTRSKPLYPTEILLVFDRWSSTRKLMFTVLMAAIASMLQSAGGLLPVIGYFISPFATAPIMLGALVSFRSGVSTYLLASCLLLIVQPSELMIFPFTTGLLGLGLGWTLRASFRTSGILLITSILLLIGICIPLYAFGFPVLGPTLSSTFSATALLTIFTFSLFYSWLWLKLGLYLLRRIKTVLRGM